MDLIQRPRRLRQNPSIREMVRETHLVPAQLIYPFFVCEGRGVFKRSKHLPDLINCSVDQIKKLLSPAEKLGIKAVVLFGVVQKKDSRASGAFNKNGPVANAIREIRSHFPNLQVATDIALDPYTDHGHDGLFKNAEVLNDETVEALCKMSLLHAECGAQIVSPSDMMDGRIGAIRGALDAHDFKNTMILSYTAKYASCLYEPFRETLDIKLKGDKKSYQMDPANRREALKELMLDVDEGADIVMVKPALWYLDIIADFKVHSPVPIAAYHVSGEGAMLELGAKAGIFDYDRALLESLLSIKRAGADLVVTYQALAAAKLLR